MDSFSLDTGSRAQSKKGRPLLTVAEAAEALGCSDRHIKRLIHEWVQPCCSRHRRSMSPKRATAICCSSGSYRYCAMVVCEWGSQAIPVHTLNHAPPHHRTGDLRRAADLAGAGCRRCQSAPWSSCSHCSVQHGMPTPRSAAPWWGQAAAARAFRVW